MCICVNRWQNSVERLIVFWRHFGQFISHFFFSRYFSVLFLFRSISLSYITLVKPIASTNRRDEKSWRSSEQEACFEATRLAWPCKAILMRYLIQQTHLLTACKRVAERKTGREIRHCIQCTYTHTLDVVVGFSYRIEKVSISCGAHQIHHQSTTHM